MQPPAFGRIAIAAVLFAASLAATRAEPPADGERLRAHALELVNAERTQQGLRALEAETVLRTAAQRHAEDMLRRDYYGHVSPEGENPRDRYIAAGGHRSRLVAENIARCSPCGPPVTADAIERLHRGWMNSPVHRDNILNPGLTRFGFGFAGGAQGRLYAVQTFAGPGAPLGGTAGEKGEALAPGEQLALGADLINRARHRKGLPPLAPSDALTDAARALVPEGALASVFQGIGDIGGALPPGQQGTWRSLSVVAGGCDGCGDEPTAADVDFFHRQWLDDPEYQRVLMSRSFTHVGLAVLADGEGRKVALAVLGDRF